MFVDLLQRGGLKTEERDTAHAAHTVPGENMGRTKEASRGLRREERHCLTEVGVGGCVPDGDLELEQGQVQEVSLYRA